MGPPLEATRGSRSPPVMLASLDPFEAFGLSGCEEQKEKVRMHIKSFLSLILDTSLNPGGLCHSLLETKD